MSNIGLETNRIYPNYTNYLFELPDVEAVDCYLLFNPSIHYWIATDEKGAAIARKLGNCDFATFKNWAIQHYMLDEAAFNEEVLPFIERLLELGFFTFQETSPGISWVPDNFSLQNHEDYPFNDLYVSLVDNCNLDCVYCFNKASREKRRHLATRPVLSELLARKALAEFKALGGSGVCFTGGEPTLHPGFMRLCEAGKANGLKVRFITNGTLLKTLDAQKLVQYVDVMAVSLDTLDQSIIPKLWGTDRYNAREDVLFPLKRIADASISNNGGLSITIKPIVSSANMGSLRPMVEEITRLLGEHAVSWDFTCYEPIGKPEVDTSLSISEANYVNGMLGCTRTLCYGQTVAENDNLDKDLLRLILSHGGKLIPGRQIKIASCFPSFFMTGNGDVYPCQELETDEFHLGNIAEESLKDMFYHPMFVRLRTKMTVDDIEECGECELRYVCARHCHGQAQQKYGRTNACIHGDRTACRSRCIKQLWLETQLQ